MNSPLVRCPNCKRHIYSSESACPFCTRQTNSSPAIVAAAISAGLAIAGCGSEAPPAKTPIEVAAPPDTPSNPPQQIAEDPKPEDPKPQDPNDYRAAPAYGAAPVPVPPPTQAPASAYGAAPPMNQSPPRAPR